MNDESNYHSSRHTKLLVELTNLYNRFHDLINCFFTEILLQELPLDGGFAWPIICFNIIWKEMLFTRWDFLPLDTHPGFYCTMWQCFFSPLLFVFLHDMHTIIFYFGWASVWNWHRILSIESSNYVWFMSSCASGLSLSHVSICTVQPQSSTILFLSHVYISSNLINRVFRMWQFEVIFFCICGT